MWQTYPYPSIIHKAKITQPPHVFVFMPPTIVPGDHGNLASAHFTLLLHDTTTQHYTPSTYMYHTSHVSCSVYFNTAVVVGQVLYIVETTMAYRVAAALIDCRD